MTDETKQKIRNALLVLGLGCIFGASMILLIYSVGLVCSAIMCLIGA